MRLWLWNNVLLIQFMVLQLLLLIIRLLVLISRWLRMRMMIMKNLML